MEARAKLPATDGKSEPVKYSDDYRFDARIAKDGIDLSPLSIETFQVNITKLCNQACVHCHVDSSPRRREMMSREAIDRCLEILARHDSIKMLDITGGAPELHADFRYFVEHAVKLGKKVMVRHNLTVTEDPHPITKESMAYLPDFFTSQKVEIVSSLPYYQEFFTDKQRGSGVFQKSMKSLKLLNERGYGMPGSGLVLNLVYNPVGAFLPPAQAGLEADYKRELDSKWGIKFNNLFALTNMPIHRFKFQLKKNGGLEEYMEKLVGAFNVEAAKGVMCRSMISVSYDGFLYDCDFNQMLEMNVGGDKPMSIFDFDAKALMKRRINFKDHCYGCTAGAGSSCGGVTS